MPASNAASTGVISEQAPAESASTAAQPQTETQSASTSILEKLGVPAEVQKELKALKPESAAETPVVEEPANTAEQPETPHEEEPIEEQPEVKDGLIKKEVFDKRVGKLSRQKAELLERAEKAEEEREALKAQLEGIQPVTVAPHSGDVLANVQNEQQLAQVVQEARVARDWCRQHPQGVTLNEGKDNEQFISPEEIATSLSRAEDVLMFEVPRKNAELQQRHQYDGLARTHYAPIFDRKSEDYQVANALLAQLPGLATHPAKNLILGDYLRGVRARLGETKPNGTTTLPPELNRPIPPIAPNVPTAPRGGAAQPSRKKADQAMNQHIEQGGGRETLINAIRERRLAARQQTSTNSLVSV